MPKDLRSFLRDVIEQRPGEIKRVSDQVDPRFGATALAERFARESQYPALYFEKIGTSDIPLVLNLTATYDRLALALGTTVAEMVPTFGQKMTAPVPAVEVSRDKAPVKDVIWTGTDIDLGRLPFLTHNELDSGPFITSGIGIMRDPESGRVNAGIYRHQVRGRGRTARRTRRGHARGALRPAGARARRDRHRGRSRPSGAPAGRAVRRMAGPLHRRRSEAGDQGQGDHHAARRDLLRHLL